MDKVKLYIVLGIFALIISATAAAIFTIGKDDGSDAIIENVSNTRDSTGAQSNTNSGQASIDIKDRAYTPNKITVKVGTKITWTNQDDMEHSIVPDKAGVDFKRSSLLKKGESFSTTFNNPGTYTYYCGPHPDMRGTIEVID